MPSFTSAFLLTNSVGLLPVPGKCFQWPKRLLLPLFRCVRAGGGTPGPGSKGGDLKREQQQINNKQTKHPGGTEITFNLPGLAQHPGWIEVPFNLPDLRLVFVRSLSCCQTGASKSPVARSCDLLLPRMSRRSLIECSIFQKIGQRGTVISPSILFYWLAQTLWHNSSFTSNSCAIDLL